MYMSQQVAILPCGLSIMQGALTLEGGASGACSFVNLNRHPLCCPGLTKLATIYVNITPIIFAGLQTDMLKLEGPPVALTSMQNPTCQAF